MNATFLKQVRVRVLLVTLLSLPGSLFNLTDGFVINNDLIPNRQNGSLRTSPIRKHHHYRRRDCNSRHSRHLPVSLPVSTSNINALELQSHFQILVQPIVHPALNVALVSSSIAILLGYHINLARKEDGSSSSSNTKTKTWRQYQADTRESWSRHVRQTEGWLYAIQSLRNAITAQTFLATTVLSLLTLITGRIWDIIRSTVNVAERNLLTVQLTTIAMTMLGSAYQFLQGVRLMTHAGFMFPVMKNSMKVDNIMRQTQNCQWLGLRWMYISLAPIAWVVGGSRAFFMAALMLLQFFRSIDKQPEGLN
mmetsp:Transcript_20786/g.31202  ORF Transcript_20786/g.31202 Transcript_20786/m.31202 type:complete len:308 (-) Transcript_20786:1776-2699(-)